MGFTAELDRLASRVRLSARDGGLIETAQVKLLGLDEVRNAAGTRWPRMREHVREGSIKMIASRLGPDDAVIPCGDGFLVVFANASPEAMRRHCEEISNALLEFYLGEEALKTLRANVERETLTAANLAGLVSQANPSSSIQSQRNDLQLGRFWPIWSTRHQAIAAYLCAPMFQTNTGQTRLGYNPDFLTKANHHKRDHLDFDLCLLEQACAAAEQKRASPIGVSVHATTLQSRRSRNTYLDHIAANASPLQQRMFITVSEIEPGTPLISLTEWSNALKRTFSRVAFDFHHTDRALASMGSTGIWAAGYLLPQSTGASGAQLRATLNELNAWCRTLRHQGIRPFVNGFEDSGFFDLAAYSDVSFITGEGLWPSRAEPAGSISPETAQQIRQPAAP